MENNSKQIEHALNALQVYKDIKDLRVYYATNVHGQLPNDVKHTVGKMTYELLYSSVRHLAQIVVTHDLDLKLRCAEAFLVDYELILDYIESMTDCKAINYHKSAVLFAAINQISEQIGSFRKALKNKNRARFPKLRCKDRYRFS